MVRLVGYRALVMGAQFDRSGLISPRTQGIAHMRLNPELPAAMRNATTYSATVAVANWREACREQRRAYFAWQEAPAGPACEAALEAYRAACDAMDAAEQIMRNT